MDEMIEMARVAGERPLARRHLVEHGAEREQVRPGVDRFPFRLFGRHVRGCAENPPFSGGRSGRHGRRARLAGCIRELREAEVEHLDSAVVLTLSDYDVAGLQIAVRDPFLVSGSDCVRHGNRNPQELGESQAAFRNHFGEGSSFDQFHREEWHALEQSRPNES